MYFTNSSDPKRSDEALVMRGDVKRLIFKATHPGQVFRAWDLAQRLGISESYISQLLCRTRRPSPKLRRRMLEALAPLTFQELFTVEGQ